MPFFRRKSVVLEAMQATGTPESNRAIIDWTRGSGTPASMDKNGAGESQLLIETLEGTHWVTPGDWIMRGVKGEHYPCKPDVFPMIYEPADLPDRLTA
jgi:hypothetical protein